MFSKLRIDVPHPWNWSVSLRLERTVAVVTLSPIQGGRSSFFAFLAGERGAGAEGWALTWLEIEPSFHCVPSQLPGITWKCCCLTSQHSKPPSSTAPGFVVPLGFPSGISLLPHIP